MSMKQSLEIRIAGPLHADVQIPQTFLKIPLYPINIRTPDFRVLHPILYSLMLFDY